MSDPQTKELSKYDIINHLIATKGYKSFLEISSPTSGCGFFNVTHDVPVRERIWSQADRGQEDGETITYRMSSDAAFDVMHQAKQFYDLILVDGWHDFDHNLRDVNNALARLNDGGIVLIHDVNPATKGPTGKKKNGQVGWSGDAYKVGVYLRMYAVDLDIFTVDTDIGVAVVQVRPFAGEHPQGDFDKMVEWQYFSTHRKELLGLVSPEEFFARFP